MTGLEKGWSLDWGTSPFPVSRERARVHADLVLAPTDDALRERYAALAIAEGDPIGEHVRLSLLAERTPAPWIDDALVDLRARYGRAIFAPWCASPFGRSLGRWLARPHRTSILRRGLVGHFSDARVALLLRRFGHRAVLPYDVSPGPLPEPDLDPWWR